MIFGIILASGFSRRMNKDKLLLPVEGVPLVERVIRSAAESQLNSCILVYREEKVMAIGKRYGLQTAYNEYAQEGQSASVKLGVIHAPEEINGYLFLVGDQPYMNARTINRMIECHHEQPDMILAASYGGQRGNPVLFPAFFRKALLELTGDCGGRRVMDVMPDKVAEIEFDDTLAGIDIDTPESYKSFS